jgi:hypothetical protein
VHHGRLDKGVQPLTKPFTVAELGAKVRNVLDGILGEPAGRPASRTRAHRL